MRIKSQMLLCLGIGVIIISVSTYRAQQAQLNQVTQSSTSFREIEGVWIDSLLSTMTLDEKIGQMFMLAVSPNSVSSSQYFQWAERSQIGGILLQDAPANELRALGSELQSRSPLPLLVGLQGSTSARNHMRLPDAWELASISDDSLVSTLGRTLRDQSSYLNAHIYFSPQQVHKTSTVPKTVQITQALLQDRIIPCVSFTGEIQETQKEPSEDALTYQYIVQSGVDGLSFPINKLKNDITEHVNIEYDATLQRYFQTQVGFEGLMFSRIDHKRDLTVQLSEMMRAGIDMIVLQRDVEKAKFILTRLVKGNILDPAQIDIKVKKILQAKLWTRANNDHRGIVREWDEKRVNPFTYSHVLDRRLSKAAITLLQAESEPLPLRKLAQRKICLMTMGNPLQEFYKYLNFYAEVDTLGLLYEEENILEALTPVYFGEYNTIILALGDMDLEQVEYKAFFKSLQNLETKADVIVVNFNDISHLSFAEGFPSVLQAHNNLALTQSLAAQAIFGGISVTGIMPETVEGDFVAGAGVHTLQNRLAYGIPEDNGIRPETLRPIDGIIEEGLREQAMPGCQLMVVHKGNVIYNKSHGFHTYDSLQSVDYGDLYDIASITKVAATTLASMRLSDEGKINMQAELGRYFQNTRLRVNPSGLKEIRYARDTMRLEDFEARQKVAFASSEEEDAEAEGASKPGPRIERYQDSLVIIYYPRELVISSRENVFTLTLEELMTHHSGLPLELPLYPYFHNRRYPHRKYRHFFDTIPSSEYAVPVANRMYMKQSLKDSLWKDFMHCKLVQNKNYQYSDMNMILVQTAIDSITGMALDEFLNENFYGSLGLQLLQFNPRPEMPKERIVPTEKDHEWRLQLLRGYVHDPAAALMGGVAGNAGLFSNANDLAVLFQMLLNGGEYGGERYLSQEVIDQYTARIRGHRGLGFDKPPIRGRYNLAPSASRNSYGHTGFTGTCVWVDPEQDLVYVFLSNRVFPSAENHKINQLRIRERVHQVVYNALKSADLLEPRSTL